MRCFASIDETGSSAAEPRAGPGNFFTVTLLLMVVFMCFWREGVVHFQGFWFFLLKRIQICVNFEYDSGICKF